MAKLKERFHAVPDGEIYPRWFEAGEEVSGAVADAARECGLLDDKKPARAPSAKAMDGPAENK